METQSSVIEEKIMSHPVNTMLRDDKEKTDKDFTGISILKMDSRQIDIPENFDGRKEWEGLITPPMKQGNCGSCWAFATTGMLSDRFNIQSCGMMHVVLSPTKLILCDFGDTEFDHPEEKILEVSKVNVKSLYNSACYGNTLVDACRYLYNIGTSTYDCLPYSGKLGIQSDYEELGSFTSATQLPLCTTLTGLLGDMCANSYADGRTGEEIGTPIRFYRALNYYSVPGIDKDGGSERNIRDNIYKWGPVATGIKTYTDFYTYDGKSIYEWNGKGKFVGGHAVMIVGWGIENEKKFWWVKNSWGTDWGDGGYFRMTRGVNMCDIEANCVGVIPDFFYPVNYVISNHELLGESEKLKTLREKRHALNSTAGGIDPETGYTRRVMVEMPWLDITPPIDWENLPDWSKFIAGIDSSKEGVKKRLLSRSTQPIKTPINKWYLFLMILLFVGVPFIVGCIFLYKSRRN